MSDDLKKITTFIKEHHVMTLATHDDNALSACSLFYAYDAKSISFVVASSDDTTHIKQIESNPNVAGNILLETQQVGKIQGLQFRAQMSELFDEELKKLYFKTFPYALALLPKLWQIKVKRFKMTDNKLGFGKKIIFEVASH